MIRVVYPRSWLFTHPGTRGQKTTGSPIRNTDIFQIGYNLSSRPCTNSKIHFNSCSVSARMRDTLVIPDTGYIKKTLIIKFRRFMMSECTPQIRGVLDFFWHFPSYLILMIIEQQEGETVQTMWTCKKRNPDIKRVGNLKVIFNTYIRESLHRTRSAMGDMKVRRVLLQSVLRIHDILGVDPDPRIHASD